MPDLAKYVVRLEANQARYERELKKARRNTQKWQRQTVRAVRAVQAAFAGLIGIAAARQLARVGKAAIDAADNLSKISDRLGISTEALSELEFVAARAGIQLRTFELGLQRLQRRGAEAAAGTGEAQQAIKDLNIDARELASLPLDQQLELVADRLAQVDNAGRRTATAFKLFDSEAVVFLQFMQDGAAGIRELRQEARRLGLTLDRETAEAAAQANDQLTSLNFAVGALVRTLTIRFAPALVELSKRLTEIFRVPSELEQLQAEYSSLIEAASAARLEGRDDIFSALQRRAIALQKEIVQLERQAFRLEGIEEIDITLPVERIIRSREELDAWFESYQRGIQARNRGREQRALEDQFDAAADSIMAASDELDAFILKTEESADQVNESVRQLGFTFESAFEDAIVNGAKLRDVLKGILDDIIRIIVRTQISQPFAGFLTGALSGLGGAGGAAGTGGGGFTPGGIPGLAAGGKITGGTTALVGEEGPELFTPARTGQIMPAGSFGNGGITNVFNVDARADRQTLVTELSRFGQRFSDATVQRVRRLQRNGELL